MQFASSLRFLHDWRVLAAIMVAAAGHFMPQAVRVGGIDRKYQVWVPESYDPSHKWPAILFLHGAGERGDDGERQTTVGLGAALRNGKVDVPAIIVFPQCPSKDRWAGELG